MNHAGRGKSRIFAELIERESLIFLNDFEVDSGYLLISKWVLTNRDELPELINIAEGDMKAGRLGASLMI